MILKMVEILVAALFGLVLGNYSTTIYHRLPLNKPINGLSNKHGLKPHCSNCGAILKAYEYYPIVSWFYTKFKCNYCQIEIDKAYFFLECSGMIISLLYFFSLGLTQDYISCTCITVIAVLVLALYLKHKKLYLSLCACWFVMVLMAIACQLTN